jgi:hypothetical protein
MQEISAEYARHLFYYDGEKLIWEVSRGGVTAGSVWTSPTSGRQYLQVMIGGKLYQAHRLIWLLVYGEWPRQHIDHIDGNGLNNRIENLRDVSQTENNRNRRNQSNNKTGICGVYWYTRGKKWRAEIKVGGKQIHLGYFTDKAEAAAARKAAEQKYNFHPNHGNKRPL